MQQEKTGRTTLLTDGNAYAILGSVNPKMKGIYP
jgi:hypothetical protein